jgi:hypothetical protein|tara:strand:+ start:1576 stop:1824 length:249 start_codon:yes stop_codon:yes gene_type:complete
MKITRLQLRKIIAEAIDLDIDIGDVILTGRFKNKRTVVKEIGVDDMGQPTINGMKALSFRVEKLMPKTKWSKKSLAAEKESK